MATQPMWTPGLIARAALLLTGDTFLLAGSTLLGHWMQTGAAPAPWTQVCLFVLLGILSFCAGGLYLDRHWSHPRDLLIRMVAAAAVWGILFGTLALTAPAFRLGFFPFLLGLGLGTVGAAWLHWVLSVGKPASRFRERVVVLGATPVADRLLSGLKTGQAGVDVLGYVDDRPPRDVPLTNGLRILGKSQELSEIVAANQAETIVVALEDRRGNFPMRAILDCKLHGVRVEDWPSFYEKLTGKIFVQNLRPSWLIFCEGFSCGRVTRGLKRLIDLALSSAFLVLGMPVFVLVAIAIKLNSPGPVFFRQERVGEGGRIFTLLKFRTMLEDAEDQTGPVWASEGDPWITRVGRWLRKTRLDEFPQILNVLKGEMSFIGPRPERPHFVADLQEKIPYYVHRHTVKPGITGWAQVRYRYGCTIQDAEEKLQYDLYYVKNLSGLLDTRILLSTIQVVLFGKGAR